MLSTGDMTGPKICMHGWRLQAYVLFGAPNLPCFSRVHLCYVCRIVYLDADMLVLRNIDALFDLLPGFYAGLGRAGEGKEGSCYICMRRPCLAQWMAAILVMLLLLLLQHQI